MRDEKQFPGIKFSYVIPSKPTEPTYTPEQYEESWRQTKLLMKRLQLLARGIDK